MGTTFLFGIPESGKTWKGCELAAAVAQEKGLQVLYVDPIGDAPVSGVVECGTDWRLAVRTIWTDKRHAHVKPTSEAESEILAAAVLAGGNCVAVWDEFGFFSSGRSVGARVEELIRSARHYNVHLFACTQFCGDIPPGLLNCARFVYIFRNNSWRAVERIRQEYEIPAEVVRNFEEREYLVWDAWGKRKLLTQEPPAP